MGLEVHTEKARLQDQLKNAEIGEQSELDDELEYAKNCAWDADIEVKAAAADVERQRMQEQLEKADIERSQLASEVTRLRAELQSAHVSIQLLNAQNRKPIETDKESNGVAH